MSIQTVWTTTTTDAQIAAAARKCRGFVSFARTWIREKDGSEVEHYNCAHGMRYKARATAEEALAFFEQHAEGGAK